MNNNKRIAFLISAIVVAISCQLRAAVPEFEAQRLGKDLTPVGAEKAGNKDGTIPSWNGGIKDADIPKGFKSGSHYLNPFPDDKPLFTITAENVAQYKNKLTDGQVKLFKTYPKTFRMPVYKTRRTARQPDRIYNNTRKAATRAQLLSGGNGFSGAYDAYPFPIPQNGLEALWNHIVRYRGGVCCTTCV